MENEVKENAEAKASFSTTLFAQIRKYFITGLIIIIPVWLTVFVCGIIFKLVSNFTYPILEPSLSYYIADKYWVKMFIRLSSFLISLSLIWLLGFCANVFIGKKLLKLLEKIIKNIPFVGMLYSSAKQFIQFLFGNDKAKSFKRVVFVPYPNKDVYSTAFLTGEQIVKGEKHVCVFMPTTPNPTTGFLLMFKEDEIIQTNYTIEQAFQFIMSMGVIGMDSKSPKNKK